MASNKVIEIKNIIMELIGCMADLMKASEEAEREIDGIVCRKAWKIIDDIDLGKFTPKPFITDQKIINYLKTNFEKGEHPDTYIVNDEELKLLIDMDIIVIMGDAPFYLGYEFTRTARYLWKQGLLY